MRRWPGWPRRRTTWATHRPAWTARWAWPKPRPPDSDLGLRELIERLPARQRTILVLHYGHGYSLREIAELLDLTHDNVRAIVVRTRRRLFSDWKAADR